MADTLHLRAIPNKEATKQLPHEQRRWSPYTVNGGTVVGVSGEDFCVIGGDTRMSSGYSILSRDKSKLHQLTSHSVLGSAGMQADYATLRKVLDYKITFYGHTQEREMSTPAVAQMLSNTLYSRRFFPYYAFNVLGGVDAEGKGAVFGYDAVGSFERVPYCVTGSGSALVTSLLDNQVCFKTNPSNFKKLSLEETIALVKDAFTSCGERDIYTGDSVNLAIITKEGVRYERFELKKD